MWCWRDLLCGLPPSLLGPSEYYRSIYWVPVVLLYICQINDRSQGLKVDPLGIAEGRDKSREVEPGLVGLVYLGDLRGDHCSQIHVLLHNNFINKVGPVHVEFKGVGSRGNVEVGKDTPHMSQASHILP